MDYVGVLGKVFYRQAIENEKQKYIDSNFITCVLGFAYVYVLLTEIDLNSKNRIISSSLFVMVVIK